MTDTLEPKILFNGTLIPAHEAWKRMETATMATEILERFNKTFPDLASCVAVFYDSHTVRH